MTGIGIAKTTAAELRTLADRVPADGSPPASLARQRAAGAAEAVATFTADPMLAERQQRWLDVLAELLCRLAPLARLELPPVHPGAVRQPDARRARAGRDRRRALPRGRAGPGPCPPGPGSRQARGARRPDRSASLKRFIGSPAYNVETLRADLATFVFLLGGNDGEHFTTPEGESPQ
jgi:hypothetical protein